MRPVSLRFSILIAALLAGNQVDTTWAAELYAPADAEVAQLREAFAQGPRLEPSHLLLEARWSCLEYRWEFGGYYVSAVGEPSFEFYLGGDPINRGYFNRGSSEARKLLPLDQGFLVASPDGPPTRRVLLIRGARSTTSEVPRLIVEHAEAPLFARAGALRSLVDPELDVVGYSVCSPEAPQAPASSPRPSEAAQNAPYFIGAGLPGLERGNLDSSEVQDAFRSLVSLPVEHFAFELSAFVRQGSGWAAHRALDETQERCALAQLEAFAETTLTIGQGNHERGVPPEVGGYFRAFERVTDDAPAVVLALHDVRDQPEATLSANVRFRDPRCFEEDAGVRLRPVLTRSGCQIVSAEDALASFKTATSALKRRQACE